MSSSTPAAQRKEATVHTWERPGDSNEAARSFEPRQFEPLWYGRFANLHTIVGSGEISKRLGRLPQKLNFRRERLDTPDGDWFDVDHLVPIIGEASSDAQRPDASAAPTKLAVLTHGLESSSDAPLTSRMAQSFALRGYHGKQPHSLPVIYVLRVRFRSV